MTSIRYATQYDINVLRGSDQSITLAVNNGASPYVLTGLTLAFYLKASSSALDSSGYTNAPVVVSATLGSFTITIPRGQIPAIGTFFYHVDVIAAGRSDSGCSTNTTTTVTDSHAVAGDLNAAISGTNIPANTDINTVNAGVGYTISNAATGSAGSLTFTVGGSVDTLVFGNVRVLPI